MADFTKTIPIDIQVGSVIKDILSDFNNIIERLIEIESFSTDSKGFNALGSSIDLFLNKINTDFASSLNDQVIEKLTKIENFDTNKSKGFHALNSSVNTFFENINTKSKTDTIKNKTTSSNTEISSKQESSSKSEKESNSVLNTIKSYVDTGKEITNTIGEIISLGKTFKSDVINPLLGKKKTSFKMGDSTKRFRNKSSFNKASISKSTIDTVKSKTTSSDTKKETSSKSEKESNSVLNTIKSYVNTGKEISNTIGEIISLGKTFKSGVIDPIMGKKKTPFKMGASTKKFSDKNSSIFKTDIVKSKTTSSNIKVSSKQESSSKSKKESNSVLNTINGYVKVGKEITNTIVDVISLGKTFKSDVIDPLFGKKKTPTKMGASINKSKTAISKSKSTSSNTTKETSSKSEKKSNSVLDTINGYVNIGKEITNTIVDVISLGKTFKSDVIDPIMGKKKTPIKMGNSTKRFNNKSSLVKIGNKKTSINRSKTDIVKSKTTSSNTKVSSKQETSSKSEKESTSVLSTINGYVKVGREITNTIVDVISLGKTFKSDVINPLFGKKNTPTKMGNATKKISNTNSLTKTGNKISSIFKTDTSKTTSSNTKVSSKQETSPKSEKESNSVLNTINGYINVGKEITNTIVDVISLGKTFKSDVIDPLFGKKKTTNKVGSTTKKINNKNYLNKTSINKSKTSTIKNKSTSSNTRKEISSKSEKGSNSIFDTINSYVNVGKEITNTISEIISLGKTFKSDVIDPIMGKKRTPTKMGSSSKKISTTNSSIKTGNKTTINSAKKSSFFKNITSGGKSFFKGFSKYIPKVATLGKIANIARIGSMFTPVGAGINLAATVGTAIYDNWGSIKKVFNSEDKKKTNKSLGDSVNKAPFVKENVQTSKTISNKHTKELTNSLTSSNNINYKTPGKGIKEAIMITAATVQITAAQPISTNSELNTNKNVVNQTNHFNITVNNPKSIDDVKEGVKNAAYEIYIGDVF